MVNDTNSSDTKLEKIKLDRDYLDINGDREYNGRKEVETEISDEEEIIQEWYQMNRNDLDKTILMPSIASEIKKEKRKEKKVNYKDNNRFIYNRKFFFFISFLWTDRWLLETFG